VRLGPGTLNLAAEAPENAWLEDKRFFGTFRYREGFHGVVFGKARPHPFGVKPLATGCPVITDRDRDSYL